MARFMVRVQYPTMLGEYEMWVTSWGQAKREAKRYSHDGVCIIRAGASEAVYHNGELVSETRG